jgi:membrane protein insertase Oxa1/YidC/SpoIIIJ
MAWSAVIDVLRAAIFALAHWCGGSVGLAIFVASIATRLVMLPLTLGATRRRLVRERDKVQTPDKRVLLDTLLQFPPAAALYSAIRAVSSRAGGFMWIRDLASADSLIALVAGVVTAAVVAASSVTPAGRSTPPLAPIVISAAITFLFLSHASAGLAIYSIANSLIGGAERFVAGRTLDRVRS